MTVATKPSAVSRSVTSWKYTSRSLVSRTRAAATMATRVLPEPPRPVRVTSRLSGSSRCGQDGRPARPPERRGAGHRQLSDGTGHRLVREGGVASRVLAQDRGLEALQRLAGLDTELAGQAGPRVGVHLERLLRPVVPVQRGHQLAPQPFAGGVLADGFSQLGDRLAVPPSASASS